MYVKAKGAAFYFAVAFSRRRAAQLPSAGGCVGVVMKKFIEKIKKSKSKIFTRRKRKVARIFLLF